MTQLPAGACDCHTHVFGPAAESIANAPAYPLPNATATAHRAMRERVDLTRAVLVQPSVYGSDHSVLVSAIAGSDGQIRGVGLLDASADDLAFDSLHAAGVRALRFVEARVPGTGRRYPGNVAVANLEALIAPMRERGWHAELWAPLEEAAALCDAFAGRGVAIVLDHLAGASAATTVDDHAFQRVLKHLAAGDVWVKLVLCRTAQTLEEAMATRPLHDALLATNPDRLVWGSDYPFIRKGKDAPDPARLVELLLDWTGALGRAILVDNPATLYDFTPTRTDHARHPH